MSEFKISRDLKTLVPDTPAPAAGSCSERGVSTANRLRHAPVAADKDSLGINIYPVTEWIQLSSFLLENLLVII